MMRDTLRRPMGLAAALALSLGAPTANAAPEDRGPPDDFAVSNVVVTLANSPESQYVTVDFDVTAMKGASLEDVLAEMIVMAPDRTVVGQGGGASETPQSPNKRHFHIGPRLFEAKCPPPLYPQQLVLLSRFAVILAAIPVRPTVKSSPEPTGCHQ